MHTLFNTRIVLPRAQKPIGGGPHQSSGRRRACPLSHRSRRLIAPRLHTLNHPASPLYLTTFRINKT